MKLDSSLRLTDSVYSFALSESGKEQAIIEDLLGIGQGVQTVVKIAAGEFYQPQGFGIGQGKVGLVILAAAVGIVVGVEIAPDIQTYPFVADGVSGPLKMYEKWPDKKSFRKECFNRQMMQLICRWSVHRDIKFRFGPSCGSFFLQWP